MYIVEIQQIQKYCFNHLLYPYAQLCKYAEEWANYLSVKGLLEHRPSSPYGENLFCSWTSLPNHRIEGREPVDSWYEEIKFHPFGREPTTLKSGEYYCKLFINYRILVRYKKKKTAWKVTARRWPLLFAGCRERGM